MAAVLELGDAWLCDGSRSVAAMLAPVAAMLAAAETLRLLQLRARRDALRLQGFAWLVSYGR